MTWKKKNARTPAAIIVDTLDAIDNRCMAADGPVTPTLLEATTQELRAIYIAANKIRELERKAAKR